MRLPGNESIEDEGAAADARQDARRRSSTFAERDDRHDRRAVLLKDINDYLRGGMLTLGGDRGRDHGR